MKPRDRRLSLLLAFRSSLCPLTIHGELTPGPGEPRLVEDRKEMSHLPFPLRGGDPAEETRLSEEAVEWCMEADFT